MGEHLEYHWYAIYTNPRAEKKVYEQLRKQSIEAYLPLLRQLKQWSDRKKWVEEPLFRSYMFVYVSEKEYLQVLRTYGVVRFITFERKAVVVPETDISLIKRMLLEDVGLEVVETHFEPGDRVEVMAGPMIGMKGELVSVQGEHRVRVSFDLIGQSVLVNIPGSYLKNYGRAQEASNEQEKFKAWNA